MILVKLDKGAIMPKRGRKGDAGLDLFLSEDTVIMPRGKAKGETGVHIAIPVDYEATVRPRSGISLNGCGNCLDSDGNIITADIEVVLGTVDSNYRGSIGIIIRSFEDRVITIPKGTKIAQLVVSSVCTDEVNLVDELDDSNRGSEGFGSSGLHDINL